MRTNLISFITGIESRIKIVKTILDYPNRRWTCSTLEDATKLPHSNVFRTLKGLVVFGILKSVKISRKTVEYELVKSSPYLKELKRVISLEERSVKSIAKIFAGKIRSKQIYSVVLYGSAVKGKLKPESDIDILVILKKPDKNLEKRIYDISAKLSSKFNKTISPVIMGLNEVKKAENNPFIRSIKANMGVVYGKESFGAG